VFCGFTSSDSSRQRHGRQGLSWYGYDYFCTDNATGTPCHATIGAKQGAPQITYEDAKFYLMNSTTGLMYNHTTVSRLRLCSAPVPRQLKAGGACPRLVPQASAFFDYDCNPSANVTPPGSHGWCCH
jgi:hypothetical protein